VTFDLIITLRPIGCFHNFSKMAKGIGRHLYCRHPDQNLGGGYAYEENETLVSFAKFRNAEFSGSPRTSALAEACPPPRSTTKISLTIRDILETVCKIGLNCHSHTHEVAYWLSIGTKSGDLERP